MFKLVKIEDSKSDLKSRIAKQLAEGSYFQYGIEYSRRETKNLLQCENVFDRPICNVHIMDLFIIEDEEGNRYNIGNHCISSLILEDLISNVPTEDIKNITSILNVYNVCMFCGKNIDVEHSYHMKCKFRKSKHIIVDKKVMEYRIDLNNQIVYYHKLKNIKRFLKGVYAIQNMNEKTLTARQMNCIDNIILENSILFENTYKMSSLYNNVILKSIQKQTRYPSMKQLGMIKLILEDFDRIKIIDFNSMRGLNTKEIRNYLKYGYVFKN